MARGTKLGALFLWLTGLGCGSPPPDSQASGPAQTGQAVVDASVSPLEAPPSLPEPTCIPSVSVAPPVEAQACAVATVWADGRRQETYYDSEGRLVELRTRNSAGALLSVETHVWQNGVELQRRVVHTQGGIEQTDWTYDEQGRLVLRVDNGSRYLSTEYEYNDQGRIGWSYTRDSQGSVVDRSDYSYDAQGRLTAIQSYEYCDLDLSRCETRSYWPNGQLRHHRWSVGYERTFSEEYDELGRLIGSAWGTGSAGGASETTRLYDSAGRLDRSQTRTGWEFRDIDALTTRVYSKGGWRERFAEDTTYYPSVTNPDRPITYSHQRITQRARFVCGSAAIALQEWDTNEDGIVDARRSQTRDKWGRRLREQYWGVPGMDDGPVSRDFYYGCY